MATWARLEASGWRGGQDGEVSAGLPEVAVEYLRMQRNKKLLVSLSRGRTFMSGKAKWEIKHQCGNIVYIAHLLRLVLWDSIQEPSAFGLPGGLERPKIHSG